MCLTLSWKIIKSLYSSILKNPMLLLKLQGQTYSNRNNHSPNRSNLNKEMKKWDSCWYYSPNTLTEVFSQHLITQSNGILSVLYTENIFVEWLTTEVLWITEWIEMELVAAVIISNLCNRRCKNQWCALTTGDSKEEAKLLSFLHVLLLWPWKPSFLYEAISTPVLQ